MTPAILRYSLYINNKPVKIEMSEHHTWVEFPMLTIIMDNEIAEEMFRQLEDERIKKKEREGRESLETMCEFYDFPICKCNVDIGNRVCTIESSKNCNWANERRQDGKNADINPTEG